MATVAQEPVTAPAGTKPVKTLRLRGVSASVFENRAKSADRDFAFHKVSLQRTYKDGDEFKTTASLGRDDLPVAALLLQRAWEFILEAKASRAKDEERS
jgi:hypothetical protein